MRLVFEQALKNTLRSCHSLFTYSSLMTPMGALCYTIYQMCMTADAFFNVSALDAAMTIEEIVRRGESKRSLEICFTEHPAWGKNRRAAAQGIL